MSVWRKQVVGIAVAATVCGVVTASPAHAAQSAAACSAGSRTLSSYRDHVYPETGNGGYVSLHTDVHLVYDAVANRFLPGNHVVLHDRATKCLTAFSLDFERSSPFAGGPDMHVTGVRVNGRPAAFRFARPTYPGDPNGPDDPDPRAHQASQQATVGGPQHNPLPPACSPELAPNAAPNSRNGTLCPANKLLITPPSAIPTGAMFAVRVAYKGRPGVHQDGDGTTDGWFRSNQPPGDGGFVTSEPVGTEDWMPLNDHPRAKPTYDFWVTATRGRTAATNGILLWHRDNPASSNFPDGSTTWRWHMAYPVASYLVECSVGHFDLSSVTAPNGVRYYRVQASSLSAARQRQNLRFIKQQPDITRFQSQFNGPFPFASDGVLVGRPSAGFEEEMEGMITFEGGAVPGLGVLAHENMHQWWGDNVTEHNYRLTFYKEGFATFGESLLTAREAEDAAGGPSTARGRAAFNASLIHQFDTAYARPHLWHGAPSDPTPYRLFSGSSTYERPNLAYIALRQILGPRRFVDALRSMQRAYGGATITETELEAGFRHWMPHHGAACVSRLDTFFRQWFDTSYPVGRTQKPHLTGPGLDGGGFYNRSGSCS